MVAFIGGKAGSDPEDAHWAKVKRASVLNRSPGVSGRPENPGRNDGGPVERDSTGFVYLPVEKKFFEMNHLLNLVLHKPVE